MGKLGYVALGVAAIAAVAVYPWTPPAMSETLHEWRNNGSFYTTRSGHEIFYQDIKGTGHKGVLVCIHGFPTSSFDWLPLLPELHKQFERIIMPDMVGFGFSEKPTERGSITIKLQADMHEELLLHLGVSHAIVLSHDYGDTVLQELLARKHDKSLQIRLLMVAFMLNGGLFPEAHKPRMVQQLLNHRLVGPFVGYLMNGFLFKRSFAEVFGPKTQPSEEFLNDAWALTCHRQGHMAAHALIMYMDERKKYRERWTEALTGERDITLVLLDGPADPVSGRHLAERAQQLVPHMGVVFLDSHIGHYPQIEAPTRIAAVLDHVLSRHEDPMVKYEPAKDNQLLLLGMSDEGKQEGTARAETFDMDNENYNDDREDAEKAQEEADIRAQYGGEDEE